MHIGWKELHDMYMHASFDTEKEKAHESCLCQSFINKK